MLAAGERGSYHIDMIWNLSSLFSDPLGLLQELAYVIPVILISLTLHEWGHAYAAYRCGDPTAKNLGRMTLNPIAHIDPIGFFSLLLLGFGWAKPVPVNSRNYKNYKVGEIVVSLAGVTMNFLLVLLSSITLIILGRHVPSAFRNEALMSILMYFLSLNVTLMVFNLIPIYPLDGYHLFELAFARILPVKVFWFLHRYGNWILIALLVLFSRTGFSPIGIVQSWVIRVILFFIGL